jgi:indole-3-glycerol phosphate synthase
VRFADALAQPGLRAIAEVKRRSPSAGDLRPDADPAKLAAQFASAGAAAISVLVDERFAGTLDDLRAARAATDAPLLGKGFFSTERHLRELREAGADAVLLILRDLDDAVCAHLLAYAQELGMDALVEAHDADELQRAMQLDAPVIGINARDLSTFEIDRRAQLQLVAQAPRDRIVIAESGVHTRAQGAAAELAGADAILVGSALMRALDPQAKLRELVSRPLVKVCGLTRQEDVDVAVEAGADLLGFILAEKSPRRAGRRGQIHVAVSGAGRGSHRRRGQPVRGGRRKRLGAGGASSDRGRLRTSHGARASRGAVPTSRAGAGSGPDRRRSPRFL